MKRIFDFVCSLIGLILLSPLFLLVAIAIKLESKGPVFFRQERMGMGLIPFRIFKFRSMTANASGKEITKSGDARITRVGRLLRKSKIDELPQLINVLKGEMSLVGPRPEVRKYVELFPEVHKTILSVRPGITDTAAIDGIDEEKILASATDIERTYTDVILPRKHALQIQYVASRSFSADLRLIFKTLQAIVSKLNRS